MRLKATESETQKAILDLLAVSGIFGFRLNTAAVKTGGRFFYCHTLGRGAADILAFPSVGSGHYRILWIETKSSVGRQQPEQVSFQEDVERRGHSYLLARSVDDVIQWMTENQG
jgi:hypothetical protein